MLYILFEIQKLLIYIIKYLKSITRFVVLKFKITLCVHIEKKTYNRVFVFLRLYMGHNILRKWHNTLITYFDDLLYNSKCYTY